MASNTQYIRSIYAVRRRGSPAATRVLEAATLVAVALCIRVISPHRLWKTWQHGRRRTVSPTAKGSRHKLHSSPPPSPPPPPLPPPLPSPPPPPLVPPAHCCVGSERSRPTRRRSSWRPATKFAASEAALDAPSAPAPAPPRPWRVRILAAIPQSKRTMRLRARMATTSLCSGAAAAAAATRGGTAGRSRTHRRHYRHRRRRGRPPPLRAVAAVAAAPPRRARWGAAWRQPWWRPWRRPWRPWRRGRGRPCPRPLWRRRPAWHGRSRALTRVRRHAAAAVAAAAAAAAAAAGAGAAARRRRCRSRTARRAGPAVAAAVRR